MARDRSRRIDYAPGPWARRVLEEAAVKYPDLSTPALLDKLLITGLSALNHERWQPPALHGTNRAYWRKRD